MKRRLDGAFWVGAVAGACLGCGAEDGSLDGVAREAVVGGANVSLAENGSAVFPYGSTVRIDEPEFGLTAGFPRTAGGNPTRCSATKIGPTRYLTAAHCADSWNGPFNGQILITNHPTATPGPLDSYTVTQVYVHPTWTLWGTGTMLARQYDIAMFDVSETNSIPALTTSGSPKINVRDITNGWWSRMVGYGSGRKAWGDNVSVPPTGDHPFHDEAASRYTSFFWTGLPSGEPGDSGGPVFNELAGGWWISGVVSGQGASSNQSRITRAEPVINWIKNPNPLSLAGGSGGYLINSRGPHCMKSSGNDYVSQWACYHGTSSSDSQFWSLQSTGVANRFRIRNGETGKCLGVADNADNAHLRLQPCDTTNTNNAQKWDFVNAGALDRTGGDTAPGYRMYQIRSALGPVQRCLAPFNATHRQGQLMHQYRCATLPANPLGHEQVFVFTR